MPDLNGFELARMIRQHPRFEETAIIFISAAHLTDMDRLEGYQRGVEVVVPFSTPSSKEASTTVDLIPREQQHRSSSPVAQIANALL